MLFIAAAASSFDSTVKSNLTESTPNTTINFVSVDGKQFLIPCTGDVVTLTGQIIVVSSVNQVGSSIHVHSLTNPQGVTGVSTSGATYQVTGNGQMRFNGTAGGQSTMQFVNNIGLIGQGRAVNLVGHQVSHLTVNGNGDITVDIEFENINC